MKNNRLSVHDSGSATLELKPELKSFIQNNIIDIKNFEDYCSISFNNIKSIPFDIYDVPGFIGIENDSVKFHFDLGIIENHDVGTVIKVVKEALQTENDNIKPINETYEEFISSILSIGEIYSSFIELMLSILYVDKEKKIIRYQIKDGKNIEIDKKYNIKTVHSILSPVLSLLYEPNIKSIKKYYQSLENDSCKVSIYEKIWLDSM